MRAAELAKRRYNVLLPYFKCYARSIGKLLNKLVVLWYNAFVNLQKFLSRGSIQPEHLSGTDLKT